MMEKMIDIDYYQSQQIHAVVSRLCASIEATIPQRLVDCLVLDPSHFQIKSSEAKSSDPSSSLLFAVDDEERYRGCEPLNLSCPSCCSTFDCSAVFSSICTSVLEKPTRPDTECYFWRRLRCPKCPEEGDAGGISPGMIANRLMNLPMTNIVLTGKL